MNDDRNRRRRSSPPPGAAWSWGWRGRGRGTWLSWGRVGKWRFSHAAWIFSPKLLTHLHRLHNLNYRGENAKPHPAKWQFGRPHPAKVQFGRLHFLYRPVAVARIPKVQFRRLHPAKVQFGRFHPAKVHSGRLGLQCALSNDNLSAAPCQITSCQITICENALR